MEVRIINKGKHPLPAYATPQSAGMDLRANLDAPLELAPGQRCLVPTGLYLELPPGTEAQVRPRSGLALKHGITVLNAPGTIDADYRGELGVLLVNLGQQALHRAGWRACGPIGGGTPFIASISTENADLRASERGTGGFGHTGRHPRLNILYLRMKIIVPMAGMGKRMRPHTHTTAKPLLPIAGKPIVQRLVEDLAAVAGESVDEVAYIVTNPAFGNKVEQELLAIAKGIGAKGSIHHQVEALGTAHAILCAEKALDGRVIVAFADTLFRAQACAWTSRLRRGDLGEQSGGPPCLSAW
jgi:dUTP pyrophosphatase